MFVNVSSGIRGGNTFEGAISSIEIREGLNVLHHTLVQLEGERGSPMKMPQSDGVT